MEQARGKTDHGLPAVHRSRVSLGDDNDTDSTGSTHWGRSHDLKIFSDARIINKGLVESSDAPKTVTTDL